MWMLNIGKILIFMNFLRKIIKNYKLKKQISKLVFYDFLAQIKMFVIYDGKIVR